jgi:hypothetical protein
MRMNASDKDVVGTELIDGLEITAYRGFHRAAILRYLIALNTAKTKAQKQERNIILLMPVQSDNVHKKL